MRDAFLAWLRKRLESEPELAPFFDGAIQVRAGGEAWAVTVRPRLLLRDGAHPAETTIHVGGEDLVSLVNGELAGAEAIDQDRVRWSGHKPPTVLMIMLLKRGGSPIESVGEFFSRRFHEIAAQRGFFELLPPGLRFEIDGASWTVGAVPAVEPGGAEPFSAEVEAEESVLKALMAGTLGPEAAVEEGRLTITGDRADGVWLALSPRRPRGTIEGTIVPGDVLAAVVASDADGAMDPVMAMGSFRLTLPPGRWDLSLEAKGLLSMAPAPVEVQDGATTRVDLRMRPA